jgi:hypothetical protein
VQKNLKEPLALTSLESLIFQQKCLMFNCRASFMEIVRVVRVVFRMVGKPLIRPFAITKEIGRNSGKLNGNQ